MAALAGEALAEGHQAGTFMAGSQRLPTPIAIAIAVLWKNR